MGHAGGEPADGLELLGLDELGLRGLDLLMGTHQLAIGVDGRLVGGEEQIQDLPAAGGDDVFLAIEGNREAGIGRAIAQLALLIADGLDAGEEEAFVVGL